MTNSKLIYYSFNKERIKLKKIYNTESQDYVNKMIDSKKIKYIYEDLLFANNLTNRPYMMGMFVSSVDGKISFSDSNNGSLIARANYKNQDGALADFWTMSMLRANVDGVIIGNNTLKYSANSTGHIFDKEIEEDRIKSGFNKIPYNILVSKLGDSIPYTHNIFNGEVPVIIGTTKLGYNNIKNKVSKSVNIIICGEAELDNNLFLKQLKDMGLNKIVVEANSYFKSLLIDSLIDELFLNQSLLYAGSGGLGLSDCIKDNFNSINHIHFKLITIHIHEDSFMFNRYKIIN